jgi:hypothetical protein
MEDRKQGELSHWRIKVNTLSFSSLGWRNEVSCLTTALHFKRRGLAAADSQIVLVRTRLFPNTAESIV